MSTIAGKERPEHHSVVVWDRLAEVCGRYLGKGQQLAAEGHPDQDLGRHGRRRWKTEIVATSVERLSGRRKKGYAEESAAEPLPTEAMAAWVDRRFPPASHRLQSGPSPTGSGLDGGTMRQFAAVILLASSLIGCGSVMPWDRAPLLTRMETDDPNAGCVLMGVFGELATDPDSGTAFVWADALDRSPVIWPHGFVGRRLGSEVEVIDDRGQVVATTGNQYELYYLWESKLYEGKPGTTLLACGDVRPLSSPGADST